MRLVRPSRGSWVLTVSQRSKTKRLLTPVESLRTGKNMRGVRKRTMAAYFTQGFPSSTKGEKPSRRLQNHLSATSDDIVSRQRLACTSPTERTCTLRFCSSGSHETINNSPHEV